MPKRSQKVPTTTLPPTLIEAEAIEFARRDIVFVREGKLKLFGVIPGSWFEGDDSRRACRFMMRALILSDVTHLMDAVALARAGYAFYEEALRELILDFQNQDRADEMPVYLKAFAMELTAGARFSKKSGRSQDEDLMRDLVVGFIVFRVAEKFKLRPTRNAALGRRLSACAVVARALELEGMATSERCVVHLWQTMPSMTAEEAWKSLGKEE